jgi:hypothetical protein
MLWQGAPQWQTLARDAMHLPLLTAYFALLLAWRAITVWLDAGTLGAAALSIAVLLPLALLALGMLAFLAWLTSHNCLYTITDKRVVLRIGIVLTVTFNLPYSQIESASVRRNSNGTGDIALVLPPSDRIAYLHLWPHVRPWHVRRPQPLLRAIADCARVSELLVGAIADAAAAGGSQVVRVAGARLARPASAAAGGPLTA